MAEEQKPQRWWQTVPAMLTAVTGLIVALHQAGVFDTATKHVPQAPNATQNATKIQPEATKSPVVAEPVPSATTPSATGQTTQFPKTLASGAEARLGPVVYKILAAQIDHYNTEKLTLRFTVRMTNNNRFPASFWDDSFRLLVDGVPKAPISGLNKVVNSHSAEDGDVVFVIPVVTQSTVLQVRHQDESAEIPVDLSPKPKLLEQKQ